MNDDWAFVAPDLLLGHQNYLTYQYRYQNTQSWSASENVVFLILTTLESGNIYWDYVPFEATELGAYRQVALDLSDYEGETLSLIRFIKDDSVDGDPDAILEIDNISIGQRID
jgi:hypothetical protein